MIKKQSIWALTLFSLILVLSVYYITLPTEFVPKEEDDIKTTVKEVENNENLNKKKKELQDILNKEDSTKEEKNNAYEELKALNVIRSKEEEIEVKLKDKYNSESYVEINDDKVKVVLIKKDHTDSLASEIMDYVGECFDKKMYITIKFEKE